jgi:hypothetical protein
MIPLKILSYRQVNTQSFLCPKEINFMICAYAFHHLFHLIFSFNLLEIILHVQVTCPLIRLLLFKKEVCNCYWVVKLQDKV